jgi:sugar phosphate isomerase/epimerase
MHPRVCLHQVAFVKESSAEFIVHCRAIAVPHMTLATPMLWRAGDLDEAKAALMAGGPKVECVNHPLGISLDGDTAEGTASLSRAIDTAAELGARSIYMLSGGRGSLDWEAAADRFAALVAPCIPLAEAKGVELLVENANAFNVDFHIAHTLHDTIALAEIANIGVCLDLPSCWAEAGLKGLFRAAMPITGLVQVSDYVLGDRSTPCRAVPGDGAIPLERLLGQVLEAGYQGVFDLELVGPRIAAEGNGAATARAADNLSELLTRLGA